MKNHLADSASILEQLGFAGRAQTLRAELGRLEHQNFKVAVIGQFKVGKSTLINKVFLQKDVLFTDINAATAVPTEIEQGPVARLEVFPYKIQRQVVTVDGQSIEAEVGVGEDQPETTDQPTPEIIRLKTAGNNPADRAAIAKRTARVRLQWPAAGLGNYTIVDTPGINEVNEAVVATTYRVIPEADATIFVTPARQLDTVDLKFLRGQVFSKGVSRCMVVVNHDPQAMALDSSQLAILKQTIQAQLRGIGRDLPVELIQLPGRGDSVSENEGLQQFQQTLTRFMDENVLPGRWERAQTVLNGELLGAQAACQIELAALALRPDEQAAIQLRIQEEARKFEDRYYKLGDEFLADLRELQKTHFEAVSSGLERLGSEFAADFDAYNDLNAVHARLKQAASLLTPKVEQLCSETTSQTRTSAEVLAKKYQVSARAAIEPWHIVVVGELRLDAGLLAKVPPTIVITVDYILSAIMLPGGPVIDFMLRWLAGYIPLIKNILPSSIILKILIPQAKRAVVDCVNHVRDDIWRQIRAGFDQAEHQVRDNWKANGEAQLEVVLGPLKTSLVQATNPARAAALKQGMDGIKKLLEDRG